MSIAVYARYSTDSQQESSIEDQVRKCTERAQKDGVTVDPSLVFTDEAVSGGASAMRKRRGYLRLMDAWEAGLIVSVYADEVSRLTRNEHDGTALLEKVRQTGVNLITNDGIDSRVTGWEVLFMIRLTMVNQEVVSTSSRTSRSMEGLLMRGLMISPPAFGYCLDEKRFAPGVESKGARWAIHPANAPMVVEMYERRKSGWSVYQIARDLNQRGIPSPRPGRDGRPSYWRGATVTRLLQNGIYKGVFAYQGSASTRAKLAKRRKKPEIVEYSREEYRLVSDELWNACNRPPRPRTRHGVQHILAGFVQCGQCNAVLSRRPTKTGASLNCPQCEQNVRVGGKETYLGYTSEKAATLALRRTLSELVQGELLTEFRSRLKARLEAPKSNEEAKLRIEVERLKTASGRLMRLLHNPEVDEARVSEEIGAIDQERKQAEAKLRVLEREQHAFSPANLRRQLAMNIAPLLDGLVEGEPTVFEARATLQRLVPSFKFVARPTRGHSVFELTLATGVFIADAVDGVVEDQQPAKFRVSVKVGAKRPSEWIVDSERLS